MASGRDLLTGTTHRPDSESAAPEFGYSYNGVAKIDHTFNDKHSITAARAFYLGQGNQTAPVRSDGHQPVLLRDRPDSRLQLFSRPQLVDQSVDEQYITAGVNYFHQIFSDAKTDFGDVATAGFITGAPFNNAPNIMIGNDFEPTGNTPPEGRQDVTGVINEAFNWTKGKHELRMGGEFRRAQVDEFYHRHAIVVPYSFLGRRKGPNGDGSVPWNTQDQDVASLADFLAGYLTKASIAVGDPERLVFSSGYDLFAQDSFQVTPELNFNFGLRYEYTQPMHDSKKDLSVFRPGLTTTGIAFQGADIGSIYAPGPHQPEPTRGFRLSAVEWSSGYCCYGGGGGMFFDTPNANPFLDNRPTETKLPTGWKATLAEAIRCSLLPLRPAPGAPSRWSQT